MARNRTISQSEALYVSTGSTATGYMLSIDGTGGVNHVKQLHRIQSANYSAAVTRTDVNQYGQLSALDRIILEPPTVSLNFDYLVANAYNANTLGFTTDGATSCISGILTKATDEKNYFILTTREGSDAIGNTTDADSTKFTIGIGNGFISNFTAEGSVGNFAQERLTVEALNMVTYIGSTGLPSPAINPTGGQRISTLGTNNFILPTADSGVAGSVSAIRPGDITVTVTSPEFGPVVSDLKIQSYNISVPLSRQPLNKLGSPFPFSREITFPVQVSVGIEAEVGDLKTGDLSALYCNDTDNSVVVTLRKPQCGGGGPVAVQYMVSGAKIDNQGYNSQIGQNKRVSLQYTTTIGGPQDTSKGLFIYGLLV